MSEYIFARYDQVILDDSEPLIESARKNIICKAVNEGFMELIEEKIESVYDIFKNKDVHRISRLYKKPLACPDE